MVAGSKRVSIDVFMALPGDGKRHEPLRGEVRVVPPPKGKHMFVAEFSVPFRRTFLATQAGA